MCVCNAHRWWCHEAHAMIGQKLFACGSGIVGPLIGQRSDPTAWGRIEGTMNVYFEALRKYLSVSLDIFILKA